MKPSSNKIPKNVEEPKRSPDWVKWKAIDPEIMAHQQNQKLDFN